MSRKSERPRCAGSSTCAISRQNIFMSGSRKAVTAYAILIIMSGKGRINLRRFEKKQTQRGFQDLICRLIPVQEVPEGMPTIGYSNNLGAQMGNMNVQPK